MTPYVTDTRRSAREEREREHGPGLSQKRVTALTGATAHQLRYWAESGLVWPSIQDPGGATGVPRLWSPADVERIKEIVSQKREGLSLQQIRKQAVSGYMGYDDPKGGCDVCCDVAPFPDFLPQLGDRYVCPACGTVWTWRESVHDQQP